MAVRNDTSRPLTLWLTKDGGPVERGWRSPEQLAITLPSSEEQIPGVVVPPGKTAFTGPIQGKFNPNSLAWLRVYRGEYKLSELLGLSRDSINRLDVELRPGKTDLIIVEQGRRLEALPVRNNRPIKNP